MLLGETCGIICTEVDKNLILNSLKIIVSTGRMVNPLTFRLTISRIFIKDVCGFNKKIYHLFTVVMLAYTITLPQD